MVEPGEIDSHVETWWLWFTVALVLLLPLDLLTTLLAVAKYGVAAESNPVMRWLLGHGLVAVTAANLVVVGLVVSLFHLALQMIRLSTLPNRRRFVPVVTAWIGFLNISGILLVTNNIVTLL